MNNKEYKQYEYNKFIKQRSGYFDNVKEFEKYINNKKWLIEQIIWIENGNYGAGACLALQRAFTWGNGSKRRNCLAACGRVVLQALNGKPIRWGSLSQQIKDLLNLVVGEWLKQEKTFAIEWED